MWFVPLELARGALPVGRVIYYYGGHYGLGESNQLATAIPGNHLKVFKASLIVLEQRSLSTEEREFLNFIEHRIAPYADDLPAMSQNRNVNKAYQSISSLEAQHRVLCLGLQQEPLSRPQDYAGRARFSNCVDLLGLADPQPLR
eukprot:2054856-Pleurochrysis_carterae.AAC.1